MKGRLTRFVRTAAFQRGVLGTSRGWFVVWAVLGTARFLRKRLDRDTGVLERIELRPGESVVISDTGIPRKAFKASKA